MSADEMGNFLFTWEIKNLSILLAKKIFYLKSPDFKTMTSTGNVWRYLYMCTNNKQLVFKLYEKSGNYPDKRLISTVINYNYCGDTESKIHHSISTDAVVDINNPLPLQGDILTVICSIWSQTLRSGNTKIQTVFNRENFIWNIRNFFPRDCPYISYIEKENLFFKIFLSINEDQETHLFHVEELPNLNGRLSFYYITPLIDSVCGKIFGYFNEQEIINRWKIELFGRNDETRNLQIQLDTIYAIHKELSDSPVLPESVKTIIEPETNVSKYSRRLTKDLLNLYRDALHSDATLRTDDKTFAVHKNILSIRSEVFRAMFERDHMKEGQEGVVVIDDLDSDTVDRMLVFLYGDTLGDVSWADASKLYYAADKYAILPLKQKCAEIVKAGLSVHNACDALVLAENHSDQDLMKSAVEYINDHREILSMSEWEKLEEINYRLASKIMKQILLKK